MTLGGCSGGDDEGGTTTGSPDREPYATTSATSDPAAEPTRYADEQLVAALPSGRAQLHGVTDIRQECRDLSEPCNGVRGWAMVSAGSDPTDVELMVSVTRTYDPATIREAEAACPDGPYRQPLKWTNREHTEYTPGERVRARRIPLALGEWEGFVCQKTGVRLWPDGETSDRGTWQVAYLTNEVHFMTTVGDTVELTEALAREYVERLSVGAAVG
jgi:hypothetical protein